MFFLPLAALGYSDPRIRCISNLAQLDNAKQAAEIEHHLNAGEVVNPETLKPYLRGVWVG